MDYSVDQFLSIYEQLKQQYQRREISQQQFFESAKNMRARDARGYYWVVDPNTDQFYFYDGRQWLPDNAILKMRTAPIQPPIPQQPVQPQVNQQRPQAQNWQQPVQQPVQKPVSKPVQSKKRSGLSKASPIVALLPAIGCGGLWFLYTFIGVFKSEGLMGIDFITPAIIIGIPIVFWAFGKQIDGLLKPLHPLIGPFPKALRYGVMLGIPVFLGCGCSFISSSGYGLLHITTLISVLVAGIMMRIPEVSR